MKHVATHKLYQYWSKLRGKRPAPERREIEPIDIREILGDTFILQVRDLETYPFRLAGTRMCSAFCRELKDRNFLSLWTDKDREPMETLLNAIGTDGAAAVIGFKGFTDNEKPLAFEMLLLPLSQGGVHMNRVLGSCAPIEKPYWLGSRPIMRQEITSLRLIWPDEKPYFARHAEQTVELIDTIEPENPGADEKVVPHPSVLGAARRVGHLTVLNGGRSE